MTWNNWVSEYGLDGYSSVIGEKKFFHLHSGPIQSPIQRVLEVKQGEAYLTTHPSFCRV